MRARWYALLARVFPGRGRHQQLPGADDTMAFPKVPAWDDTVPPAEVTQVDLPPPLDRPYVDPGEWTP